MNRDQINCKHEWQVLTPDKREGPGVAVCKKCNLWLYHSNRLQLEMNRHIMGFQKWISIIAIITSIIALLVSVLVAIYK